MSDVKTENATAKILNQQIKKILGLKCTELIICLHFSHYVYST